MTRDVSNRKEFIFLATLEKDDKTEKWFFVRKTKVYISLWPNRECGEYIIAVDPISMEKVGTFIPSESNINFKNGFHGKEIHLCIDLRAYRASSGS